MSESSRLDQEAQALLNEAAEWRLLGLLFECPGPAWRERVASLADEVSDPELRKAAAEALAHAGEGLYHSLFGPGGPAPVREASYHLSVELGSLMSELVGYYQAFAYRPDTPEPPDHIAVELGFMSYLRLKHAYACTENNRDAASITDAAARRFLSDHLSTMATPLSEVLAHSGLEYLELTGRILAGRVGPPTRTLLPVFQPAVSDENDSPGCGTL